MAHNPRPSRPPAAALDLAPAEALWKRVPKRGVDGKPLADFMMLVRGLNRLPEAEQRARVARLSAVLAQHDRLVVFADLNLRLNLLWVSHRCVPGAGIEIAMALPEAVPSAVLIGPRIENGRFLR